jgi:hypothetical protein
MNASVICSLRVFTASAEPNGNVTAPGPFPYGGGVVQSGGHVNPTAIGQVGVLGSRVVTPTNRGQLFTTPPYGLESGSFGSMGRQTLSIIGGFGGEVRHASDLGGLQASNSNLWSAQFAQFDKTVSNQQAQYGRMPSCQIDQFSGTEYSGETGGSTAIGYTIPGTNVERGYETRSNAKDCTGAGFNSRSQPCICEERSRVQSRKGFDCLRVRERLKDNFSL